jgi:hypothetical protein
MSNIRADAWHSTNRINPVYGTPIKITTITVPYSSASANLGYRTLTEYSTSNTASLYSWTYTPARASSMIQWISAVTMDRNGNTAQETQIMFVNGSPMSCSYLYPRDSGSEPWQNRTHSGVYLNTSTSNVTFDLRCSNGGGWTSYVGGNAGANNQVMSRTVLIFEYQR